MMQLEELRQDKFAGLIHTEFQVVDDPSAGFPISLVEVSPPMRTPHQDAFALVFHGPSGNFIPQGIHKLQHGELGEISIFLVPVARDQDGFLYQAVFNRLIQAV